jgi:hypothetical protein
MHIAILAPDGPVYTGWDGYDVMILELSNKQKGWSVDDYTCFTHDPQTHTPGV